MEALDPDVFGKVDVHQGFQFVDVPEFIRSEEVPVRSSKERSQNNEQDPEDQESKQECSDFPLALFQRVVTVSFWIGVNVWNCAETHNDQAGEHDTGKP